MMQMSDFIKPLRVLRVFAHKFSNEEAKKKYLHASSEGWEECRVR